MAALTMNQLKNYVTGGPDRNLSIGAIRLDITHNLLQSRFVEIEFMMTNSIADVKSKIHGMTGSNEQYMRLLMNGRIEMRESDNKLLGEYEGAQDKGFIHVIDEDPFSSARGGALDDVTQVKKFELTEEEYDKRDNTYRAYKRKMIAADPNWKSIYQLNSEKRQAELRAAKRAGGYPDDVYEPAENIRARISVGQRCVVEPGSRRGEVKYVGVVPEIPNYERVVKKDEKVDEEQKENSEDAAPALEAIPPTSPAAPIAASAATPASAASASDASSTSAAADPLSECLWIGVSLDEPVGKHDGSVKGKKYFQAMHHCGIFAKPSAVKTGDYPVVDPFDEDEEEQPNAGENEQKQQDFSEEL